MVINRRAPVQEVLEAEDNGSRWEHRSLGKNEGHWKW